MVFKGQKHKEGPKGTKSSFSEVARSEEVNPQEADKGRRWLRRGPVSWRPKENPLRWKERKERESVANNCLGVGERFRVTKGM